MMDRDRRKIWTDGVELGVMPAERMEIYDTLNVIMTGDSNKLRDGSNGKLPLPRCVKTGVAKKMKYNSSIDSPLLAVPSATKSTGVEPYALKYALTPFVFLGALLFFSFNIWTQAVAAEEPHYQVEGSFTKIEPTGKVQAWTDFLISVDGHKSSVSNRYFNGELLITGCDGTNSFFVNKMSNSKSGNTWEWARVTPGAFPTADLAAGQFSWLAFAAFRDLLQDVKNLPIEGFPFNEESLRSEVTYSSVRPELPRTIKWYGPNRWNILTIGKPEKEIVTIPYSNFLAAEFTVTATTNIGPWELPSLFEVSFYSPFLTSTNGTLAEHEVNLSAVLRGRIKTVRSFSKPSDFRPELGSRVQIRHFGLPEGSNGYVRITRLNGKWPEESDPDFLQQKEAAKALVAYPNGADSHAVRSRKLVTVVVLISGIVSAFLVWFATKKTERK